MEVITPRAVRTEGFLRRIESCQADYLVVVAFGRILPEPVLAAAKQGALNIHPSLLPRWRGPAPVAWTLYHGDGETGVSIMQMNAEMDAGDIVRFFRTPVFPDESADQLLRRLSCEGARLLLEVLKEEEAGNPCTRTPQDHALATIAPLITPEMAWINWNQPAVQVARVIRAFDCRPGAFSFFKDQRIKFFCPKVVPWEAISVTPGTVMGLDSGKLLVACREHAVAVGELQWPGRRRCSAKDVLTGHPMPEGTVLRGKE